MTGVGETTVPLALLVAIDAYRVALDNADRWCRFHEDVPPPPPALGAGCESCAQPARVRKAIALMCKALGEPPPVRRYTVDTTGQPHPVSGMFPVFSTLSDRPIRGLYAPGDAAGAQAAILRELDVRGETGPFTVEVAIRGCRHDQ